MNGDSWFLCSEPRPHAALRLFCFPHAGVGASMYREWPGSFPPDIEVRGIQLPGREARLAEPRMVDIAELVREVARALDPYLREPYALFGYSMGALLAFELARELRRGRAPSPAGLFLGAMRAPQVSPVVPPLSGLPRIQMLQGIDHYFQPEDAAWQIPELLDFYLPILRDDLSLIDGYRYVAEPPLQCPLHVYSGVDDRATPLLAVEAWRAQAAREFSLTLFPGTHFFLGWAAGALQNDVLRRLTGFRKIGCRPE